MGLYNASFVSAQRHLVLRHVKNVDGTPPLQFKAKAIKDEDAMLRECERQQGVGCYHMQKVSPGRKRITCIMDGRRMCLCNLVQGDDGPSPREVYGAGSSPRLVVHFPCANMTKYKANYQRGQRPVMMP